MRPIVSTLCLVLSCLAAETLEAAELKQETSSAFSRYIVLTEERMARSLHDGDSFYSMGGKPELQREALRNRLRQGEIIIDQMETLDGDRPVTVPGGLVHHWIALGFIPGVNLNQALALLQDYEQYPVVYQPDVKRSKLLSTDGTHFNIYLRLYQKTIVTAVFNAEFEVTYFRVDERRAHSRSYSKRIAEVENPDLPKERERPVGNDRGFLWRLYSYWRLEERDGGIYVELESVGLSRSVPVFFAWLVHPLLKSLPKSYLSRVLNSTRTALTKRQPTHLFDEETADCFETRRPYLAFKRCRYCCLQSNLPADMGAQPMDEPAAKLRPFTKVSRAQLLNYVGRCIRPKADQNESCSEKNQGNHISIRVILRLVVLSFSSIGGDSVQEAAENHPIVVTEAERKASVAKAASLKPDDLPALLA